jgi:hypothetical protein
LGCGEAKTNAPENGLSLAAAIRPSAFAQRTIPRLRCRIGSFARNLTASDAANYLRAAGHA